MGLNFGLFKKEAKVEEEKWEPASGIPLEELKGRRARVQFPEEPSVYDNGHDPEKPDLQTYWTWQGKTGEIICVIPIKPVQTFAGVWVDRPPMLMLQMDAGKRVLQWLLKFVEVAVIEPKESSNA